jgi:flagellar basal-body rod protein FlgB
MIPGLFNDPTSKVVRTALSGLQQRQQVISDNIANVDTPNYKAKAVSFEDALKTELAGPPKTAPTMLRLGLETTHERHIPLQPIVNSRGPAKPETFVSADGTLREDGNTVDVEREMSKLAETQIMYSAIGQLTGSKFGILRTAINEGRR